MFFLLKVFKKDTTKGSAWYWQFYIVYDTLKTVVHFFSIYPNTANTSAVYYLLKTKQYLFIVC